MIGFHIKNMEMQLKKDVVELLKQEAGGSKLKYYELLKKELENAN